MSSRGPTCCTTRKDLRTPELLRRLVRSGQTPGHRSQKRLDWHTCMPPVHWLQSTPSGVTGLHNTPEPPGARCSANCARKASALHPCKETAAELLRKLTELLRKLTERLQDAHRAPSGGPPESSDSTTLRCHRAPQAFVWRTFRTRTGPSGPTCTTCGRATQSPIGASCLPPSIFGRSPGTLGFHGPSSEAQPKPVESILAVMAARASFRLTDQSFEGPCQTVHRLWRHGGHFRVDPRLSSLYRR